MHPDDTQDYPAAGESAPRATSAVSTPRPLAAPPRCGECDAPLTAGRPCSCLTTTACPYCGRQGNGEPCAPYCGAPGGKEI